MGGFLFWFMFFVFILVAVIVAVVTGNVSYFVNQMSLGKDIDED